MSHTIHSVPRVNLPASSHKHIVKALTMLQDSDTFEQSRDVLLRYYYPLLRTWTPSLNKEDIEHNEERSLSCTNSMGSNVAASFLEMQKGHITMNVDEALILSNLIDTTRKATDATPYERVGRVYQWLRQWQKRTNSHWDHRNLRDWMDRLLIDFSLHDAKHTTGALMSHPEQVYKETCTQWCRESHGIPWDSALSLASEESYALTHKNYGPQFDDVITNYVNQRQTARRHMFEAMPPAFVFFTNSRLAFNPGHKFSWRTATDYCILHSLLTQTHETFNKEVWLDWLSDKGLKWSKPEYAVIWARWQDKGFESFHSLAQTHYEVTPKAITSLYSMEVDLLGLNRSSDLFVNVGTPVELNWSDIFMSWVTTYPYLNNSTEINKYAKQLLSDSSYASYVRHAEQHVGRQVIDAVLEIPEKFRDTSIFNIPGWLYYYIKTVTHQPGGIRYELPDNVLGDDLNSAIAVNNI